MPLTKYPAPFHEAEETTTLALFAVRVAVWEELPPTETLPKLKLEGETLNVAAGSLGPPGDCEPEDCEPEETPAQPASRRRLHATANPPANRNLSPTSTTRLSGQ